jgi:hypothetical protein
MDWSTCAPDGVATIQCLEVLFSQVVSVITALAGILFFIMLVVGGIKYLFSGGNPKATEAARGTLTAATLGLILIVAAYLILLVISNFTGLPLTTFELPFFN